MRYDHANAGTNRGLITLRRCFRAVLGDQALGDRLASALGGTDDADLPEAAVIRAAMRRWRQMHALDAAAPFTPAAIAQAVSPSASLPRQVGVLIDILGLSLPDAADALDRSEGEVTILLAEGRRSAEALLGRVVLIVEDDPFVAEDLAQIAKRVGARAVDIASDALSAYAAASARRPDIAICDYDLGSGEHGGAVLATLSGTYDTIGVFVTAHPARVLSGTEGEPAYVIPKPFSPTAIRAALTYAASADRPAVLAA